jgi:hypothetical protein
VAQPVEAEPHRRPVAVQRHLDRLAGQSLGFTVKQRLYSARGVVAGALGPSSGVAGLPCTELTLVRHGLSYHSSVIDLNYGSFPENTGWEHVASREAELRPVVGAVGTVSAGGRGRIWPSGGSAGVLAARLKGDLQGPIPTEQLHVTTPNA